VLLLVELRTNRSSSAMRRARAHEVFLCRLASAATIKSPVTGTAAWSRKRRSSPSIVQKTRVGSKQVVE
jgi:hypothetical protein